MPPPDSTFRHPLSWRSRIFRSVVAMLLLVLCIRLIWGWQTHRALEAKWAELRGRGQPVKLDEIPYEKVPAVENAWHYQMLAAQALVPGVDSPSSSNLTFNDYPPYPRAWWQLAEAVEKADGKAFALIRQARQFNRVQLRDGYSSISFSNPLLSFFNPARWLANTVGDGIIYSHFKGNDPEALDRSMDLLHLARSIRHDDTLISQLVGIGIEAVALNRIEIIAPGLRLHPETDAAARQRVKQLIDQLLDEELVWRGRPASLQTELIELMDNIQSAAHTRWRIWMIRPLADRQILRDIHNMQLAIEASRLRTKPQVNAVLERIAWDDDDSSTNPPRYSRVFTMSRWGVSPYLETCFRVLGERRVAIVSLAAQLYRADHGSWPAKLEDLVPAYLPAVPTDPYHDDGRAVGYTMLQLPDGTPRPMVYFDAGATDHVFIPDEPLYTWQIDLSPTAARRRDIRQYRDLSRFIPPPSPKAIDDDAGESNAPGDQPQKQDHPQKP